MMDVKAEKGIPLPIRYPWETMEVGESFTAPLKVRNQAGTRGIKLGRKFQTKRVDDGVYRIWRVE